MKNTAIVLAISIFGLWVFFYEPSEKPKSAKVIAVKQIAVDKALTVKENFVNIKKSDYVQQKKEQVKGFFLKLKSQASEHSKRKEERIERNQNYGR
jgi:hypothetical protein